MNVLKVLLNLALGAGCLFAGIDALDGAPVPRYLAFAVLVAAAACVMEAMYVLAESG